MSNAFLIPMKVYGLGIIISLGIAVLIKVMMMVIKKFSKDEKDEKDEVDKDKAE